MDDIFFFLWVWVWIWVWVWVSISIERAMEIISNWQFFIHSGKYFRSNQCWLSIHMTQIHSKIDIFYFMQVTTFEAVNVQYIPRNMHTVFALLYFVVFIHWLIFPYPSGLLHWHCGNLTIAPVPAKQPWWIGINTSCEFIMNDCITTTKQSTTKPCAYFLGYTVHIWIYVTGSINW